MTMSRRQICLRESSATVINRGGHVQIKKHRLTGLSLVLLPFFPLSFYLPRLLSLHSLDYVRSITGAFQNAAAVALIRYAHGPDVYAFLKTNGHTLKE